MKNNFSLFIYFLQFILSCKSDNVQNRVLMEQDLIVDVNQDGEIIQLIALKSTENDAILAENNSLNHFKLKWYSIGIPIIVKKKSHGKEVLFHFTRSGFNARIQMLTNEHKQLLIDEVKNMYNISVRINQIQNLILSSFKCDIPVHSGAEQTIIPVFYLKTIVHHTLWLFKSKFNQYRNKNLVSFDRFKF